MRNKEHFDKRAQGGDYSACCMRTAASIEISRQKNHDMHKTMRAAAAVLVLYQQLFIEPQQQKGETKRRIYSHDYP
jgi:hypothetical protein